MYFQLIANEENKDSAQGGKDNAGGMKTFIGWAPKEVGNGPADNRAENSEHNCPEDRHVNVYDRFGDHPRN